MPDFESGAFNHSATSPLVSLSSTLFGQNSNGEILHALKPVPNPNLENVSFHLHENIHLG